MVLVGGAAAVVVQAAMEVVVLATTDQVVVRVAVRAEAVTLMVAASRVRRAVVRVCVCGTTVEPAKAACLFCGSQGGY